MLIRNQHNRAGFTLIELLVVMTLILVLAGLGVAFLPTIGDSARQAQGATMLQQWILQAKQKALRDQVPCGLRLVPYRDPATGNVPVYFDSLGQQHPAQVRECQFIEQPDDFPSSVPSTVTGIGTLTVAPAAGNSPPTATINKLNLGDRVASGDYLEIQGNGLMHRIIGVSPGSSTVLTLSSGFPYAVNNITQYRIVRAPRVTGDDILQFPDPVMIDLKTNYDFRTTVSSGPGYTLPQGTLTGIDILFAPSGAVISTGVTTDTINLWVRDFDANKPTADPTDGQQTIIAVYVRSGLTAAHPPAGVIDPYAFIKDGKTSGK